MDRCYISSRRDATLQLETGSLQMFVEFSPTGNMLIQGERSSFKEDLFCRRLSGCSGKDVIGPNAPSKRA